MKDSYDWFRGMVRDRRQLDAGSCCRRVSDGRVFTGRQAVELKLIDELGDEQTAIDWLAKEKNIDAKTPVRDCPLKPAVRRPAVPARRRCSACSTLSASTAWPSGSRSGAPSRRSSGSTLTVYWRFGTLRQAIDGRDAYSGVAANEGQAPMIKSELVQRISDGRIRISISATSRTSSTPSSTRSSPRWRAATGSSCAASAPSR